MVLCLVYNVAAILSSSQNDFGVNDNPEPAAEIHRTLDFSYDDGFRNLSDAIVCEGIGGNSTISDHLSTFLLLWSISGDQDEKMYKRAVKKPAFSYKRSA